MQSHAEEAPSSPARFTSLRPSDTSEQKDRLLYQWISKSLRINRSRPSTIPATSTAQIKPHLCSYQFMINPTGSTTHHLHIQTVLPLSRSEHHKVNHTVKLETLAKGNFAGRISHCSSIDEINFGELFETFIEKALI